MNNIDTDINGYSIDELYDLVNLSTSSKKEEIEEFFSKLIQTNIQSNNFILAQFFHNAKEKIIANLSQTNQTDETNQTNQTNQTDDTDEIAGTQDYSQTTTDSVIHQPTKLNPNKIKLLYTRVSINSRDRPNQIPLISNPAKLNSSVNFIVSLTEPLTNVLSIKLESINVPNTIMTLDPIYSNNTINIYITSVTNADGTPNFFNTIPTKINITPGTYTSPIDFINQINLDLSCCVPPQLKAGGIGATGSTGATGATGSTGATGATGPPAGSLLLQAHLVAPLTKNPKVIFINSSEYYIAVIFYELKDKSANLPSVGVLENDENPCYIKSVYNNNLGYFMGYRISEDLDGKISNYIETSLNGIKYTDFGIILYPPQPATTLAIQNKLTYIYNKLLIFDLEYSLALYSQDIFSFINIILDPTAYNKYYKISSVPLNLSATKYIYLCLNDYQNNRGSNSVIRISDPITKIYPLPEYVNRLTNYSQQNNNIDLNSDIFCDAVTKTKVYIPSWPRKVTQNQLYSLNAILQDNRKTRTNINDNYITDVIATIPVDPSEATILTFIDHQPRFYFGPVRIEKLEIKLKDDNGRFVNLNGTDWGFSIIVEQLYKK
jgi:hypothetical protein